MAQRDDLEIDLDIGEDFAAQFQWTDDNGDGYPMVAPCRMDIRDSTGDLVLQFKTGNTGSTQGLITLSGTSGIFQMTAPKTLTRALAPGMYLADFFATVTSADSPFTGGVQQVKVFSAQINAYQRTTIMES